MSRPSRNQDQLLIKTAIRLLPETGVSGMTLKRVADECGVNLGMFHYHFKTKSEFVQKVLDVMNDKIQKDMTSQMQEGASSLECLRTTLINLAFRFRDNQPIILSMYRDLLNQDVDVSKFFFENSQKRIALIAPLVEQCQREAYLEQMSVYQIMTFCAGAIFMPILISESLDRLPMNNVKLPGRVKNQLDSDEAILQRVDLALKAVTKSRPEKPRKSSKKSARKL